MTARTSTTQPRRRFTTLTREGDRRIVAYGSTPLTDGAVSARLVRVQFDQFVYQLPFDDSTAPLTLDRPGFLMERIAIRWAEPADTPLEALIWPWFADRGSTLHNRL